MNHNILTCSEVWFETNSFNSGATFKQGVGSNTSNEPVKNSWL